MYVNNAKVTQATLTPSTTVYLAEATEGVAITLDGGNSSHQGIRLQAMTSGFADVVLSVNQRLSVGRRPNNDIVVDHATVSSVHCFITVDFQGTVQVEDNNSSNGTYVNAQPVQSATIRPGDTLWLASEAVSYRLRKL